MYAVAFSPRVLMRTLLPVTTLVLATASCASSGSSPGTDIATPSQRVVATDNQGTYRTTVAPNAKVPVPAAAGRVFDAVRAVYDELGIPVAVSDAATGQVGNTNFFKTRKLGTEALSTYVNCGDSFGAGTAADTYRVYLSILSMVHPDGSGASQLETSVMASAQNMEGTASDRITCGTTGRLEERIRQAVLRKVAAGSP
jgi:hypothetical protein